MSKGGSDGAVGDAPKSIAEVKPGDVGGMLVDSGVLDYRLK